MHAVRGSSGFTVVEVLVALVLISMGVLALAGSFSAAQRMLGRGRRSTLTTVAGQRRLEELRRGAHAAAPGCPVTSAGADTASDGITERWDVRPGAGTVLLRVVVTARTPHGEVADTLATAVACG